MKARRVGGALIVAFLSAAAFVASFPVGAYLFARSSDREAAPTVVTGLNSLPIPKLPAPIAEPVLPDDEWNGSGEADEVGEIAGGEAGAGEAGESGEGAAGESGGSDPNPNPPITFE